MPWAFCAPGIALSYTPGAIAAFEGRNDMDFLRWLFEAQIPVGGSVLVLREVLGNIFGLTSALGGMRRKVWALPIGIAGNLLLLTVFLGNVFGAASQATLWGQAGRQIMFIGVAVYGWYRWRQGLQTASQGRAIVPGWAHPNVRIALVAAMFARTAALTPVFAGFFVWWRANRRESQSLTPTAEPETVGAPS